MQPLDPAEPAMAALLEAPERAIGLHRLTRTVHMDHARLQFARHMMGAAQILGVDIGAKAIVGAVGERDRLFLILERRHDQDRTEHLILGDLALVRHVGQNRHRQVEAIGKIAG